jgi:hypothetical protein
VGTSRITVGLGQLPFVAMACHFIVVPNTLDLLLFMLLFMLLAGSCQVPFWPA